MQESLGRGVFQSPREARGTLVRVFAKAAGLDILEVNLERQATLDSVFRSLDVARIIHEIEGLLARRVVTENAECDYVVAAGEKILPVEVKAGAAGSLTSLHQFYLEKKSATALRLDLNKPSRFPLTFKARDVTDTAEVHFELLSLPLYAGEALGSL